MTEDAKKASVKKTPPAKKQEVVLKSGDEVKVENTGSKTVFLSTGKLESGKKGKCTLAESRSYKKVLKAI